MSMSSWPASSPVHMPMDIEFESVASLEREFCSNFACCGEVHADLHALIAHHEAAPAHVHPHLRLRLRLAAAPQPPSNAPVAQVQPHNDLPATTPPSPSSSSSSSTCSSQPDSPITPFDSPLHNGSESNPKDTTHVLPDDLLPELEYPTYEHCYHAAIASESTSTSALFSRPDAREAEPDVNPFVPAPEHEAPQLHTESESAVYTMHPLSPLPGSPAAFVLSSCFARAPSVSSGSSGSSSSSGSVMSPSPSPSPSPMPIMPTPAVKSRTGTKRKAEGEHAVYGGGAGRDVFRGAVHYVAPVGSQGAGGGGVKRRERGKAKERAGRTKVKGREKLFACPTPGCTKSYLNPNGLKYHLDKGTCVLDADALLAAAGREEPVDPYPVGQGAVDVYPNVSGRAVSVSASTQQQSNAAEPAPDAAAPSERASASASPELGFQYPTFPPAPQPAQAAPLPAPASAPTPVVPAGQPMPTVYQPQPVLARQRSTPLLRAQAQVQATKQLLAYHSRPQVQAQPQPQPQQVYRALYMPQGKTQAQVQRYR